jgi:hypothetical protein
MEIHGLRFSFKGRLRPCVIAPKDDGYTCAKAAIFFFFSSSSVYSFPRGATLLTYFSQVFPSKPVKQNKK